MTGDREPSELFVVNLGDPLIPAVLLENDALLLDWVLIHTIEEYARHLGHADLLRERIDGALGQ